jgi:glucose-6-phosphate isomerase
MGLKALSRLFSGQYYKSNRKQSSASYGIESESRCYSKCEWQNVIPEIYEVKEKMKSFSSLVISGKKKGTGKQFTDVLISELGL